MKADYHIHSDHSDDSTAKMEDLIKSAVRLNYDEICFTEHVEYAIRGMTRERQVEYYKRYFEEISQMRKVYQDKILIKTGIEFGVQVHTEDWYKEDVMEYTFDFVLLSVHEIDGEELCNNEYQKSRDQYEYNLGYYLYLLRLVESYQDYSVIAHFDLIKRYDKRGVLSDAIFLDIIRRILYTIIKNNKGIEVNTSSFRYGLIDTMPSITILKLYLEMGGKIITIGSDAHKPEDIGDRFELVFKLLKDIGFKEFCTFEQMRPIFHLL